MLIPSGGGRESGSREGGQVGWRAGEIEIDTVQERVLHRGVPIALDLRHYALLVYLIEHAGSVASKDDLLRIGWPNRVVSENSLAKAMSKLRQLFGDEHGELIRVVHGYGYRLAATTQPLLAAARTANQTPAKPSANRALVTNPTPAPRLGNAWRITWLFGALALVAGWVLMDGHRSEDFADTRVVSANEDVIAVLPFRDTSPNGTLGLFADGLANHLRSEAYSIPALRMISRAKSYGYRTGVNRPAAIAEELGANLIVSGEVSLEQDKLRVTMQVYDSRGRVSGERVTFLRAPYDQATLLDEITGALYEKLGNQPDRWGYEPNTGRGTSNPQAYQTFMRAATLFNGNNDPNSHRRTLAILEEAIALDPNYADALLMYGGLFGGSGYYADSTEELVAGRKRAIELMTRGIKRAPDDPSNYLLRSEMRLLYDFDWRGAQEDIDAARARTPGGESAMMLIWMARYAASLGRIDEAIALDARANLLDPQAGGRRNLGWHYLAKGDTQNARAVLMLQLEDLPENPHTNFYLALCDILEGTPDAALPRLEHSSTLFRLVGTAVAQYERGDLAASDLALTNLRDQFAIADGYWVGAVYAWRGENDFAIQWLERAIDGGDSSVMYLPFDPLLRRLRDDPRYALLLKKLRLPD